MSVLSFSHISHRSAKSLNHSSVRTTIVRLLLPISLYICPSGYLSVCLTLSGVARGGQGGRPPRAPLHEGRQRSKFTTGRLQMTSSMRGATNLSPVGGGGNVFATPLFLFACLILLLNDASLQRDRWLSIAAFWVDFN